MSKMNRAGGEVPPLQIEEQYEHRRGCGYRKAGPDGFGLYLVSGDGVYRACTRLPFPLRPCGHCGHEIHHQRSPIGIDPSKLFSARRAPRCTDLQDGISPACWFASPTMDYGLLLWVGAQHYRVDEQDASGKVGEKPGFCEEAMSMGISRRVPWLPDEFVPGKTPVFLAHVHAVPVGHKHHSGGDGEWRGKKQQRPEPGVFGASFPVLEVVVDHADPTKVPAYVERLWDRFGGVETESGPAMRVIRPIPVDDDGEPIGGPDADDEGDFVDMPANTNY